MVEDPCPRGLLGFDAQTACSSGLHTIHIDFSWWGHDVQPPEWMLMLPHPFWLWWPSRTFPPWRSPPVATWSFTSRNPQGANRLASWSPCIRRACKGSVLRHELRQVSPSRKEHASLACETLPSLPLDSLIIEPDAVNHLSLPSCSFVGGPSTGHREIFTGCLYVTSSQGHRSSTVHTCQTSG